MIHRNKFLTLPAFVLLAATAACGGETQDAATTPASDAAAAGAPATSVSTPAGPAENSIQPAAEGKVIEVQMVMPGGSNPRFEPENITAKPGDVIRFVNAENVHNISFPAAENPGATNLPAASPYLTNPGQTYELKVEMAPGTYTFQCDPHAAMGMKGKLTVAQ